MAQVSGGRGTQTSGWAVGFTFFAAFMMMMIGTVQSIEGLAAIFKNEFFVVSERYAFKVDATAWGWIHLLMGLIILGAGFGLFSGADGPGRLG